MKIEWKHVLGENAHEDMVMPVQDIMALLSHVTVVVHGLQIIQD